MIPLARQAAQDIAELRAHYEAHDRPAAIRNLVRALEEASGRIKHDPARGLGAPRPYPDLAKPGRAWIKAGRYWIAYRSVPPPVILGVFYDTANIPARLFRT